MLGRGTSERPRWIGRVGAGLVALGIVAALAPARAEAITDISYFATGKADGQRYELSAYGWPGESRRENVSLTVGDRFRSEQGWWAFQAFYAPASRSGITVGRKRIESGFGRRGSVGLRFRVKRKRVERFGPCVKLIERRGVLRGYLRFRGENRYVEILEHRLRASQAEFRFKRRCARASGHERRFPVTLLACGDYGPSFVAIGRRGGRSEFAASSPFRRHRGVLSATFVVAAAAADTFIFNADRSVARVTPPYPFRGVGGFSDDRLTGELRFSAPSTGRVRVAPAAATIFEGNERLHCPPEAGAGSSAAARFATMARTSAQLR